MPNGGPALEQIRQWLIATMSMRGLNVLVGKYIGPLLQHIGLANVKFGELSIPIGNYGGRLGVMAETHYDSLLQSFRPVIIGRGLTDGPTFDVVLRTAHDEIARGRFISPYHLAYGQRPFSPR